MTLQALYMHQFRNIPSAEFADLAEFNFIHGLNGSGKTSVLEAIYTLSVSHSFRTRKVKALVREGEDALVVRGRLGSLGSDESYWLGVQRSLRRGTLVKYQGERLSSAGEMAGILPAQVIDPDSFALVEGSPSQRRQFLDWSVFHVKHYRYFSIWARYKKSMQQRNSLLRRGKIDREMVVLWEKEMAASGQQITVYRTEQFENLKIAFGEVYGNLARSFRGTTDEAAHNFPVIDLEFSPGWDEKRHASLADALERNYEGDLRHGLTRYGPHRADIYIRVGNVQAAERLSRGQIKTLVCALKIAQCQVMAKAGVSPVLLIDDLPAELDRGRRQGLFQELVALGAQVFATSIEPEDLEESWCGGRSTKRFHVEHGRVVVA